MEGGATTTTLADALLDDLDDLSDYEAEVEKKEEEEEDSTKTRPNDESSQQQPSDAAAATTTEDLLGKRFLNDSGLQSHLQAIIQASDDDSSSKKSSCQKEDDEEQDQQQEEYRLIVQSNKHLSKLSDELHKAHGALCTAYGPKFPELEDLLPNNPIQYKDAVAAIGNEMDFSRCVADLSNLLTQNQIITLSVAGSTTSGRPLDAMELKRVQDIIEYMNEIVKVQTTLSNFVEQRMQGLAPNISALIGPKVAARILGQAGGLAELVRIPACNLQVLGQVKQSASSRAGLSSSTTTQQQGGGASTTTSSSRPHAGLLMECDLVQTAPRSLQAKVLKTVAAKLALAARCDYTNLQQGRRRYSTAATAGEQFRAQIQAKLTAWQEPDKAPVLKALPK